jgi:hypothetical protein
MSGVGRKIFDNMDLYRLPAQFAQAEVVAD